MSHYAQRIFTCDRCAQECLLEGVSAQPPDWIGVQTTTCADQLGEFLRTAPPAAGDLRTEIAAVVQPMLRHMPTLSSDGIAAALMPVITAAITEATAALRAERDARGVMSDSLSKALAEYKEDLRRWHARAEAAEARIEAGRDAVYGENAP